MDDAGLRVMVALVNEKVQFTGVSTSNPDRPITFDYKTPIGDGQGYSGLELLLLSFAGCVATTVVYLLRKMGKTVSGLQVNAKGIRRGEPPIKLERILLEFAVASKDAGDADMEKVIHLAEESVCPVWQMVKNNVDVVTRYPIV